MISDDMLGRIRGSAQMLGDEIADLRDHSLSEHRKRHLGRAASYLAAACQEIDAAVRSVSAAAVCSGAPQ